MWKLTVVAVVNIDVNVSGHDVGAVVEVDVKID